MRVIPLFLFMIFVIVLLISLWSGQTFQGNCNQIHHAEIMKLREKAKDPHKTHPDVGYIDPFNVTSHQDTDHGLCGAGVILVKENSKGQPIIYVGQRKKQKWVFPAGHCEKDHDSAVNAAVSEAFEETGGVCYLNPEVLTKAPSIRSLKRNRKLFVVYVNDSISKTTLNSGLIKAKKNPHLPKNFKEIKEYRAVPVSHFLQALHLSTMGQNDKNIVKDNQGKKLPMNSKFYQTAVDCYEDVKSIMVGLFGEKVLKEDDKTQAHARAA